MSAPSSSRLALRLLTLAGALAASAGGAGAAPQEAPPNYEEHVQPILREWC
ncbi:MAG: hypothetical protein ISQ08_11650, partial [Planctomycetes bacterium]|nr:hypothetical protein [Planctomycetota bacterium]